MVENVLFNLKNKSVYKLFREVPKGKNIITAKRVFTYKRNDV